MLLTLSGITTLSIVIAFVLVSIAGRNRRAWEVPALRTFAVILPIAIIAIFLLLVGLVSNTIKTHLVQILPLLLALAVCWKSPHLGMLAAIPLYLFWLAVMTAIWLFLLGIARFVSGTFSPTEIVLTILIAVAAIAGVASGMKQINGASLPVSASVIVGSAVLQCIALITSYLPAVTG